MPQFNFEKAKSSGYSDQEINDFLAREHPRFDREKAKKSGYNDEEINQYLSSPEAGVKKSDFSEKVPRAIAQIPLGLAESTGPGLLASGLKLAGKGEALSALEDELSPERLADLREKFPGFGVPKEIDREKYLKSVEDAANSFPTVENISRLIEEKTGMPLQPQSDLDNSIRFISSVGGFAKGGPADKLFAGLKTETARQILNESGVPEPAADALALYYGLRSKTVKPTTALKQMEEQGKERLPKEKSLKEKSAEPSLFESEADEYERLGKSISPSRFETDAKAGRTISSLIKNEFQKAKADWTQKYAKARAETIGKEDIFPTLSAKTEEALASLHESATPSTAEKSVIKQLQDLQKLIGNNSGLIQAPLDRLVKTADSIASSLKYEIPDPGVKNILKGFVRDMNQEVISSIERQGGTAKWLREADKAYAKGAELYFSDELSPFLAKTIRNPESLSKLAQNPGSFRAIQEAIGNTNKKAMAALKRKVVEQTIRKYIQNPLEVLGLEFEEDMKNLQELIGPKAKEIRNQLYDKARKKKIFRDAVNLGKSVAGLFGMGKAFSLANKASKTVL